MKQRVCGAVLKNGCVLMVRHKHGGREYWTLPGGGVEAGETHERAAVREMYEETGLTTKVARFLYEERYSEGVCRCYLMTLGTDDEPRLGYDPEEAGLTPEERMLQGVGWRPLDDVAEDIQVSQVLKALRPDEIQF